MATLGVLGRRGADRRFGAETGRPAFPDHLLDPHLSHHPFVCVYLAPSQHGRWFLRSGAPTTLDLVFAFVVGAGGGPELARRARWGLGGGCRDGRWSMRLGGTMVPGGPGPRGTPLAGSLAHLYLSTEGKSGEFRWGCRRTSSTSSCSSGRSWIERVEVPSLSPWRPGGGADPWGAGQDWPPWPPPYMGSLSGVRWPRVTTGPSDSRDAERGLQARLCRGHRGRPAFPPGGSPFAPPVDGGRRLHSWPTWTNIRIPGLRRRPSSPSLLFYLASWPPSISGRARWGWSLNPDRNTERVNEPAAIFLLPLCPSSFLSSWGWVGLPIRAAFWGVMLHHRPELPPEGTAFPRRWWTR